MDSHSKDGISSYDLAYAAGFSDAKYLNQQFKKHLGCSLKAYRKTHMPQKKQKEDHSGSYEFRYQPQAALALLQSL